MSNSLLKQSSRVYFIYYVASQAIFDRGIFILFLVSKGFSNENIGLLQSILFVSSFLFEIPTGLLSDKYGRKKSVIIGLLIYIGYCFSVISFAGMAAFILFYISYGLAMSLVSGSDRSLIYEIYKQHNCETSFIKLESLCRTIGSIVLGAAIIIGGVLQTLSWDMVYLAYATALVISLIAIAFIPEKQIVNNDHKEDFSIVRDATSYFIVGDGRTLLPIILFMACIYFVYTPYLVFSQSTFKDQGVSVESISIIFAIVEFVSAIGYFTSDKIPEKYRYRIAFFICPLLLSVLFLLSDTSDIYVNIAIFFLLAYVVAVIEPIYISYINSRFASHIRSFANSFSSFINTMLISTGFYLYSLLGNKVGFGIVAQISSLFPFMSILLVYYYFRKERNKK
ncbi:MFS transporter [Xenorhabdus bovienii]|uniref:MFS transporter n=1 Tax=Xenorhabdus bovienii TaxID=40576 RepID=UPI0023B353B3|nr:MFS transporter [Xenorhabdus bovienii]MDE9467190.1 MFS transporter [Xenorhabdus bovienii]